MDMTTDTLQHIENQALAAADKKIVKNDDGKEFLIGDDVHPYHTKWQADEVITTSTLSSIVDYLKAGIDGRNDCFIHVVSPTEVALLGPLDGYGERELLMVAKPTNDSIDWGRFYSREAMNILLQAQFQPMQTTAGHNDDRDAIVQFIGNLVQDNAIHVQDDGVTQTATVKQGIANQGEAMVPNPVLLKPYRTFTEIDQPESNFIFRINDDMESALFEADGGAWRQQAIKNIKGYFEDELPDELKIMILG